MGKRNQRFKCMPLGVSLTLLVVQLIVACNLATKPTTIVLKPSELPLLPGITFTVATKFIPSDTPIQPLTPTVTLTQSPTSTTNPTFTSIPSVTLSTVCFHLLNPSNGLKLSGTGVVKFEWEPHSAAQKYLLEITAPDGHMLAFDTFNTSVERYLITLPWEGIYSWQVAALNSEGGVLCIAEPLSFSKPKFQPSLTPERNPPPPRNPDKSNDGGG